MNENILDKYICKHPFSYLDVNHFGSYMCCPAWLRQDITEQGKLTITEAWDGELANKIRQSVTDGTYKYCNKQLCPALNRLINTGKPDLFFFVSKEKFDTTDTSVKEVLFGQDRSCNLRCPSCRKTTIHNYEEDHEWKQKVQDEIKTSFGGTIKKVLMTGSGDPIYSKIYKDFLINFNKKDFPNLKEIQLVTNGNLLNKRMWSRFNCTEYIDTIDFGIDAGTKDTYEKIIRLGGDWDKLMKNIKFLASLDDRYRNFVFSFVVTQYNYKEMGLLHDIIKEIFKTSISGFCMNYRQIVYWSSGAYSEKEIENISVFSPTHAEHQNFIEELRKINNIERNINHNFHHLLPMITSTLLYISNWIKDYAINNNFSDLVIGVSGGIDSAVTSALCCMTKLNVHVLNMPIHSADKNTQNSRTHCNWLKEKFNNVVVYEIDLSQVYDVFKNTMSYSYFENELGFANSKARIRMTTLYQVASNVNGLVVGTGNKVEDFGVGFYTKYGDGGVDISPIADLYKTEVYKCAKQLDIHKDILNAPPTDGLWEDNRTDQDQLGLSYEILEQCMENNASNEHQKIYNKIRKPNLHKMIPIPICKL